MNTDVVIIGGGIGGLTSAALLAKKGIKVILIDQENLAGGLCRSVTKGGYRFDRGTGILWGFGEGEIFHRLFRALQIEHLLEDKEKIIYRLEPSLQIIMPNHRLNVYADRNAMAEEIQREFPEYSASIYRIYHEMDTLEENLFHTIPHRHPFSMENRYRFGKKFIANLKSNILSIQKGKMTATSLLKKEGVEIENFFNLQLSFLVGMEPSVMPLTLAAVLIGISRRGIYKIAGGTGRISNILKEQIKQAGGKILNRTVGEEIIINRGRVSGVKARKDKDGSLLELKAKHVIANLPYYHINNKLLRQRDRGWRFFSKKEKTLKDQPGLLPFTVFLGVDSKVIPEPMKQSVVMMRSYQKPLKGTNLIFISVSPEGDKTRAPKGKRAVTATYWLSGIEAAGIDWKEERGKKIYETIGFLEQVIPFISNHVNTATAMTPEDYKKLTGKEGEKWKQGTFLYGMPVLSVKTPVKGLYTVSGSSCALPGAAHVVKMGMLAAEEILQR